MKQYLTCDTDVVDLQNPIFGDVMVVPSYFYQAEFSKHITEPVFVKPIFSSEQGNKAMGKLNKSFSKVVYLLKAEFNSEQYRSLSTVLELKKKENFELILKPHPRGLPKEIKEILKGEVTLCSEEWNRVEELYHDALFVTFNSASLFEIISRNLDRSRTDLYFHNIINQIEIHLIDLII